MKSQAIGELKQTTINRIRLVIGTPEYADDVRKQCYYFISELVAAVGPQPFPTLVKRATIFRGAQACGFEDRVIYRWMLHPEFKSNQRGFYNLSLIFDSLDPENDEVPGPWKTKIPGQKPAARKKADPPIQLEQTVIDDITAELAKPEYADDVRKQSFYFMSELAKSLEDTPTDDPSAIKRATIFRGAQACGFEDRVIYRWMLHPEFKHTQRGLYNLDVILNSLDPENDEVPGPWKTKIPGQKPAAKKPAKAKAKAKKTRVPKAVKELPSRSEQRAAMRDIENEVPVDEQLESNMVMNNHSIDYDEYDHNDFGIEDAVMADV